jgi:hypothetical protein
VPSPGAERSTVGEPGAESEDLECLHGFLGLRGELSAETHGAPGGTRIAVRQNAFSGKSFGQMHGLLDNFKKLFHATVQQNQLILQAENKKVFENICASVQFTPIPYPSGISGERHAVRFRALPCINQHKLKLSLEATG